MEIDSQFFWSGAPWDMVSRTYVADTLNRGLHRSSYDQTNVIAVSAMEAIGLSSKWMLYADANYQNMAPASYRYLWLLEACLQCHCAVLMLLPDLSRSARRADLLISLQQ